MKENIVDIDVFREELDLDYNVLRELYLEFSKELIQNKDDIDNFLSSQNIEELSRVIHSLKGVSGNYKAVKLYEVSKKIDSKLKSNDYENITYYMIALNEIIEESLKVISNYFEQAE